MKLSSKKAANILDKLANLLKEKGSTLDVENVHHIRTSTRKAETLLAALPERLANKAKLALQLKKARKRAGGVRDADVQIELLQGLPSHDPVLADQKRYLIETLQMQRLLGQRRLQQFLEAKGPKIRKRLRKIREVLPKSRHTTSAELAFESDDNATLREALRRYHEIARAYPALDAGNLHDFRKRCKHVRYLVEMGKHTPEAMHFIESLTSMQDAVGAWHDWQTLRILAFDLGMHHDLMALILSLEDIERRKYAAAIQAAETVTAGVAAIMHGKPLPRKKPQIVKKARPETTAAVSLPA